MKRYVSEFLRAHGRELLPGTSAQDRARLAGIAWKWWQSGVRCRPDYQKHVTPTARDSHA